MIFIPGQVMSKKNSTRIWQKNVTNKVTGKQSKIPFVTSSKQYKQWAKDTEEFWWKNKIEFLRLTKDIPKPWIIGLHFVRNSKQKFDFNNMSQGVMDEMQHYAWLVDDDMDECFPVPFTREHFPNKGALYLDQSNQYYTIDKESPGVYISLFKTMILQ